MWVAGLQPILQNCLHCVMSKVFSVSILSVNLGLCPCQKVTAAPMKKTEIIETAGTYQADNIIQTLAHAHYG